MFVTFKETKVGMIATIGGKLNKPTGIGTVKWTWKNDGGVVNTELLENALYFPHSPNQRNERDRAGKSIQ